MVIDCAEPRHPPALVGTTVYATARLVLPVLVNLSAAKKLAKTPLVGTDAFVTAAVSPDAITRVVISYVAAPTEVPLVLSVSPIGKSLHTLVFNVAETTG